MLNSRNLVKYYEWAIKGLVFVIPFLSLWISTSMFFPYITGRNFAFRILIEIAFALWVALAVLKKEYRPKMTPMLIAILAFLAVIGIADAFGVDFYSSFWSRLERMEGYMMLLHLAAYFVVLTNVFRTKKDWLQFFRLVVVAGFLVGSYGVLQLMGLKPAIQGGGFRIDGTIGNPTYLAAYLMLVVALAFILLINSGNKVWRYIYWAAIVFNLVIIFFTATRGAAIAFVVALPLFLVLHLIFEKPKDDKEKKIRKWIAGFLAAMVVLPILVFALRGTGPIQNNPVLSRLTSISFGERTIKSRFMIWGIAWQAFKERPILGWGQENFIQAFSKYFDPGLYDQEPWFDRPHNIIFEWLIDGGILGLLAYLSIFGVLVYYLYKLAVNKHLNIREALLILVAVVAYLLQNFFVFDNFNTYVLFFALLAYLNSLYAEKFYVSDPQAGGNSNNEIGSYSALGVVLVVAGLAIYFLNVRGIAQAQGIISSLKATTDPQNAIQLTYDTFKNTLRYGSFGTGETLEQLSRVASLLLNQSNIPNQSKKLFTQFAVESMENYLKDHPNNIRMHLMVASLYEGARTLDNAYFGQSRVHLQIAHQLSPKKQQILFLTAQNYLLTGEMDKALSALDDATKLDTTYRDAYVNYATLAILMGRNDLVSSAVGSLNKIRLETVNQKYPELPLWNYVEDLQRIFRVYMQVGQKGNARIVLDALLDLRPAVAKYHNIERSYGEVVSGLQAALK
ncbi:MAG: O-antigen ligase family protein [bacterium]|nr:O-antigen ligase family protein [bacterium]